MNYNKIKQLFFKTWLELKEIIELKRELIKLNNDFNAKKDELELVLIKEINFNTKKLNKIKLLNNNKVNFDNNDFKIKFNNKELVVANNNFTINYNREVLTSAVQTTKQVKIKESKFDFDSKLLKVELEEETPINFLQYSFLDIDNSPLLPKQIYYNDLNNNNLLIDNYQKKLKKDILNDTFTNTFTFTSKLVKTVYFQFDYLLNKTDSKLYFGIQEYKNNSSIIYKIPIKELNGFLLYKDTFEEYVNLDFSYSLNNKDYIKLEFENNIARIVFNKEQFTEGLYIKLDRKNLNLNNTENKIINEVIIKTSKELKIADINFNVPKTSFDIIVDNQFYFALKDKLPMLFTKREDQLIQFNTDLIKRVTELNPLQELNLKNSNDLKMYDSQNYPLFYLDNNSILYMPKIFADQNYNFVSKQEKIIETFKEEYFTPVCFNFSINVI